MVSADGTQSGPPGQRQRATRIDTLYLEWRRNRGDEEALQRLHEAIGDYLAAQV